MSVTISEAQTILEPYLGRLAQCIDLGWNDFVNECSHIRYKMSPRSRACIVHDNIVHHAKQIFEDDKNILIYDRNGTLTLQIEEIFLLRFKKLDEEKFSSGIATQVRMDFLGQGELPGIQRGTNIIAGYELNRLQTSIKEKAIACPNGDQNTWILELPKTNAEIIPIHAFSEDNTTSTVVRIKNTATKKVQENNE
jgi:hypothetical protein